MFLWCDATANFERLSYPDSIRFYVAKAAELGFTDLVIDVKPITGEVLYPSAIAPQMKEWGGFRRPDSLDFLTLFLREAHRRHIRVEAALNIFSAGHNFINRGVAYSAHPEWASVVYTDSGTFPMTAVKAKYATMIDPSDPAIEQYELSILREVVTRYPLDGIILDRVRYDGICADFSAGSRLRFEAFLGRKLDRFPGDIFEWKRDSAGTARRVDGPFFRQWLEWRAKVIHDFIARARTVVKGARPGILFADYVGSWYPIYFEVGANWASQTYDPSPEYSWATPAYRNSGYAEMLDFLTTGNYYPDVTEAEVLQKHEFARTESGPMGPKAYWYSVEGACRIVRSVVRGVVPAYGGLYVEQYRGEPEQFRRAVSMCLEQSDGLMIFDLVHLVTYNWWDVLKEGMGAGGASR